MKDSGLERRLLIKEIEVFGQKIFRVNIYEELALDVDEDGNVKYSDDDLVELRDRLRDILRTVGGK